MSTNDDTSVFLLLIPKLPSWTRKPYDLDACKMRGYWIQPLFKTLKFVFIKYDKKLIKFCLFRKFAKNRGNEENMWLWQQP